MRHVIRLSPRAGVRVLEQTAFAALDASVAEATGSADFNSLTPNEAMALLAALQEQLS